MTGNHVYGKLYQGFESLSLRQIAALLLNSKRAAFFFPLENYIKITSKVFDKEKPPYLAVLFIDFRSIIYLCDGIFLSWPSPYQS
jgi:hypothetical protein